MQKLYVVTRSDLTPGAIVAQACHAVSAFAVRFPSEHRTWHSEGQNLVVLACPNAQDLDRLIDRLESTLEIPCVAFFEPDLDGALTAFAVSDAASKYLSQLPLALREPRCPCCKEAPLVSSCTRCAA